VILADKEHLSNKYIHQEKLILNYFNLIKIFEFD